MCFSQLYAVFFLSMLAIDELRCARVFMLVSTAGHIALFPLLYQPAGKLFYVLCCETSMFTLFHNVNAISIESLECTSHYFFDWTELLIKVTLCFIYWAITYIGLSYIIRFIKAISVLFVILNPISYGKRKPQLLLTIIDKLYLAFLAIVQVYCCFLHDLFGIQSRLEFLPLLLTSVSSAIGVIYSWTLFYFTVLTSGTN